MASALKKQELPANEYIFREGEMGTAAYLILDGTVEIRLGAFGDTPKLLATLVKGDVIGEMALFDERPHMASAIAMNKLTVAVLSSDDFKKRVDSMDTVMRGILNVMTQRLRLVGNKEIIKTTSSSFGNWDK